MSQEEELIQKVLEQYTASVEDASSEVQESQSRKPEPKSQDEIDKTALEGLEEAVLMLPQEERNDYCRAKQEKPHLIERESNPIWFLKFEKYNTWSAAKRLCFYWHERVRLFRDRAFLPMTMTGDGALNRTDIAIFKRGASVFLPNDSAGRSVMLHDATRRKKRDPDSVKRLYFYFNQVVMENPLSPTMGFVCIVLLSTATFDAVGVEKKERYKLVEQAFPTKNHAVHTVCKDDFPLKTFVDEAVPLFHSAFPKDDVKHFHKTSGDKNELAEFLDEEHGLPKRCVPLCLGGDWDYEQFEQWKEKRFQIEWKLIPALASQQSSGGSGEDSGEGRKLSEEERKDKKRRYNILYTRRRRKRDRQEADELEKQIEALQAEKVKNIKEGENLQSLLSEAQKALVRFSSNFLGPFAGNATAPPGSSTTLVGIAPLHPAPLHAGQLPPPAVIGGQMNSLDAGNAQSVGTASLSKGKGQHTASKKTGFVWLCGTLCLFLARASSAFVVKAKQRILPTQPWTLEAVSYQPTPHSGRHFRPSHPSTSWLRRRLPRRKRFMEGWYYRLTLPNASFALIISIEDAGNPRSDLKLACMQVVGPDDSYLVQADRDDTKFWASKKEQSLGYTFSYFPNVTVDETLRKATFLERDTWYRTVESGFQISPTSFVGKLQGHDGSQGGVLEGQGTPGDCEFDFTVTPICGWGNGKSTGGWLSHFSVFEPHWQVTLADARASGRITWQNRTYNFSDAKFYAEKNWGAALPAKWYWTQCNSFEGFDNLSVTAGGGVRGIPFGGKESLGMVAIHYNNTFFEATPWTGDMSWNVTKWGSWELTGRSIYEEPFFEARVSYTLRNDQDGLVFRAPTPDEGMVYFCRDTFEAMTTLTLWELEWDKGLRQFVRKESPPLIDGATSLQGGAEVGGGPWWDTWTATSKVSKPVLVLLRSPLLLQKLRRRIRGRRNNET